MHLVRYDSWQMAVLGAESFLATEDMHDFYDNNIRSALSEADLSFKPDAGAESSLVRRVSSFHGGLQDTAFSAEAEDANAAQLAVADQLADSLLRTDLREEPVEPPTASIVHPLDKQPGPLCSNTDISALCVPAGPSPAAARSQPVAGMIPVTQPADMDCRNHSHTSRVVTTTHALSVPAASPPRQLAEHSPFNWSGLPSHAASAPAQHVRHIAATASSYPSGLQQPASSHAESEDGDEDEGCSRPAPSAATMPRIKLPPTAAMRMHALRAQRKPRIPGQSGASSTAKIQASGLGSKGVTKPITTPRTTLPIPTAAAVPAGPRRGSGKVVCRNCAASSTPQWRCGPEGPRTLCNACGVRYKKGMPLAYMEAKMMLAADGNSQGL